ncbi:MAG: hypothetical protein DRP71_11230 [Verrucomicrobia bacterium]|nr:MAG: hypothetical protein DRP71_11230 [Verrucomicrobiota bacterium]
MKTKMKTKTGKTGWRAISPLIMFGLILLFVSYGISLVHVIRIRRNMGDIGVDDRIVIRLAHFLSEENVQSAFSKLAKDYEELHPDTRIVVQSVPQRAYQQWLNTQQIGGTTPDLFQLQARGDWTMASKFQEVLTSQVGQVNPYNVGTDLEGVPWRDTYTDGMEGGYFFSLLEFYGIPMTIESTRIFYNKDLFRRAAGSDRPPGNFGEWMEICAAIQAYGEGRDETIFPIAATRDYALLSGFNGFYVTAFTGGLAIPYDVNAGGGPTTQGTLWGFQTGTLDFDQERVRAAYDIQLELAENYQPGFMSDTADQARFLFIQGRAGMLLGNTYDLILFRDTARFDVGVFRIPLPDPDDPKYGRFVTGRIWEEPVTKFLFGLSKRSSHKEIALDFMKFATSLPNNEWFCRQLDWFPAIRGAETSDELQVFAPSGEGVSASLELVTGPDIGLYFDHNFLLFLGGHLSFDEFMDGLEEIWRTKGEEWLMVKRFAITRQEDISRERNLSRSRVRVLFEEAGEMNPGQTMGSGTAYQLGVQIVQAFFAHSFNYRQFIHPHIKDGTYQFPPHSLMPAELYPIPPPDHVLEEMLHRGGQK